MISIIEPWRYSETYKLYDEAAKALVMDTKGQVRIFSSRPSARGTRSRLNRGIQNYLVRGGNRTN